MMMMTRIPRITGTRLVAVVIVVITSTALPPTVWAAAPPQFERWYAVMLEDQHVGWLHASERRSDQPPHAPPSITTQIQLKISVRRGPAVVRIASDNRFVETGDGRPISARYRQTLGLMAVTHNIRFRPDQIEWTTRQQDQKQKRTLPYPRIPDADPSSDDPGWLAPGQIQRYVQEQIEAGATEIQYWTLDPSLGPEPFAVRMDVRGKEDLTVYGKVVPALVCDVTVSNLPGVTTREYLDHDGRSVKSILSLIPGMTLSIIEADRQLATAHINPPELLASTLIELDRPIPEPRKLRYAQYALTLLTPQTDDSQQSMPLNLPDEGCQQVEWPSKHKAIVTVDLNRPTTGQAPPPDDSYLDASAMLDADDPQVHKLVNQALPSDRTSQTPVQRTEALRQFVHQYIDEKDLSVGLATASEVARTGQGDCTEHAVLLAAMLRAANIPSRTVSGVIYVERFLGRDGVFGYHMWTQAWLTDERTGQGRWVDLDATLPDAPFDAAHIALSTSDMSDRALINDLVAMVPVIGRLKIKVVGAAHETDPTP